MKRLLSNPYFEHVVKAILAVIVGMSFYFIIDLRDFIKFKQPQRDKEQDELIRNSIRTLDFKINQVDSMHCLRNRNTNQRIDIMKDLLNEANRKLDYLVGFKYNKDVVTNN